MNIQFRHRCLSMVLVLVMLFTMTPVSVIAEEAHDHSHESTETSVVIGDEAVTVLATEELTVSASASANHVYVGDGAVTVTAKISGGVAPYEVQLQAVKNGDVVATDSVTTEAASAKLTFAPASYGDYELVVVVHDALHTQELVSISLAAAEHDEESEQEWAASVSGASVSSDWAKSLVSVAKTQVGYTESAKDFVIKNGAKEGYSRYGAWFGTPYGGWNTAFLAFVAEYANIPTDVFLSGSSYRSWVNGMSAKGAYEQAGSDYAPKAGDIAFLSGSRVAIIESVSGTNLTVIEGDVDGAVVRKTYALSKVAGIGNTQLLMGLYNGTATAVPAVTPEPTKAPEGSEPVATATPVPTAAPTATPVPEDDEELTFQATPTPGPGVTVAPKEDDNILGSMVNQMGDAVEQMQAAATSVPTQFSEAYYLMQDEMAKLAAKYLGEGEKTPAEIKAFVDGLELGDLYYIVMELDELEDYAKNIGFTEYEGAALNETEDTQSLFIAEVKERWALMTEDRAATGNHIPVEGVTVGVSGATDNSMTAGAVTVTAKGNAGFLGWGAESKTATITVTNSLESTATVSFDWTATSVNQLVIDGSGYSGSTGSFSKVLAAGASFTITITTAENGTTNKLVMNNFSCVAAESSVDVVFEYDSALGSVIIGEDTIASGSMHEVDTAIGVEVVATPAAGSAFLGWINEETGEILSKDASATLIPAKSLTVHAVFAKDGGTPYFGVGSISATITVSEKFDIVIAKLGSDYNYNTVACQYLFDTLTAACEFAAESGLYKAVVLMNSGTLPAAEYTIPSGVTLLIPFDADNSLYREHSVFTGTWTNPSPYRTLTLTSGTTLNVDGALSLSAKHYYASGNHGGGNTTGPYGHIQMNSGSTINVNSGATLYTYGYITGSGSVVANSGSTVYEMFQIMDFRGGTATTDIKNSVFPMSQYYVQNIEVPLTLYSGAKEKSFTSIYMSNAAFNSSVAFIASSGALFNLTSGYVVKDYDEKTDRLVVESYGDLTVSSISMDVGGTNMNSKDYVLPINSNISVTAHSGTIKMQQDLALLPGAEIIVEADAQCILDTRTSNNRQIGYNIYVYDADEWGPYCFKANGGSDQKFLPAMFAPGRIGTRTEDNLVDAKLAIAGKAVANGYFYTTSGGAAISGIEGAEITITTLGTATKTYQYRQTASTYDEIPITSAKLQNSDGSYCETSVHGAGMYYYFEGFWHKDEAAHTSDQLASCETDQVCKFCGYVMKPKTGNHQFVIWNEETQENVVVQPEDHCYDLKCVACDVYQVGTADHTKPDGAFECDGYTCAVEDCGAAIEAVPCSPVDGITCRDWVCQYCGEPQDPVPHTPVEDSEVETAPTCTVAGYTTYTCSICNLTQTIPGDGPIGHTSKDDETTTFEVTTQPGCETEGVRTYYCGNTGCDEMIDTESISPLGHKEVPLGETVPPTCSKDGTIAGVMCERCTKTIQSIGIAPKTNQHLYDEEHSSITTEPKCNAEGVRTYYCTYDCGNETTKAIDKIDHENIVIDEAVAATCYSTGLTEGSHCGDCGEIIVKQSSVNKTEHQWSVTNTEAATCNTDGYTDYKCDNCPETKHETLIAIGHAWKDTVVAPTCENQGYTEHVCENNCGMDYKDTYVDAEGHNYVSNVVAPTCTEDGYTEYTCGNENCEKPYYKDTLTSATGHTKVGDETTTSEVKIAATCEKPGESVYYCGNDGCGEIIKTEEIPATDHNWDTENITVDTPPTCTTPGVGTKKCLNDGCEATSTGEIPKLSHDFSVTVTNMDATCVSDGYFIMATDETGNFLEEIDAICSVCGEVNYEIVYVMPAEVGPAYCDYNKYISNGDGTHYNVCTRDESHVNESNVAETCFGNEDKATCTTQATCERCGAPYGNTVAHDYKEFVSNDENNHTYKCVGEGCELTETKPHTYTTGVYVQENDQHWQACTSCGYKKDVVPCSGGEATCVKKAECEICGNEYGKLAEHTPAEKWTSNGDGTHSKRCTVDECEYASAPENCSGGEATCSAKAVCSTCNGEYGEIAAEKHNYGTWTDAGNGQHQRTCSYNPEHVESDDHNYGEWSYADDKHSRSCSDCEATESADCEGGTATCVKKAVCDTCGNEYGAVSATHNLAPVASNGNGTHDQDCQEVGCTYSTDDVTCSGGEATCSAKAVCSTCNGEYGEIAAEKHNYGTWTDAGNGQHQRTCSYNPEHVESDDHNYGEWSYADDKHSRSCSDCEATESADCEGGTATCVKKAVCDTCGNEYGAVSATHNLAPVASNGNGTHDQDCQEVGCTYSTDDVTCSGGEATCSAKAVCEVCDGAYGDIAEDNHAWGDWTDAGNGQHQRICSHNTEHVETGDHNYGDWVNVESGKHSHTCEICEATETANCSGGTATCEDKAVCTLCDTEYGDVDTVNGHRWMGTTITKQPTCTETGIQVGNKCDLCGETSDDAIDIPALGHEWSAWTQNDDDTHTRVCERIDCDGKNATETDNCNGGIATCTEQATCADCNEKYGEVDANNHDYGAWVTNGNGTHSRNCSRDESHSEPDNCSGGEASCIALASCTICGGEYGELAEHTPAEKWTSNGDGTHSKICTVENCGHVCETAECDGSASCIALASCTICGGEYGELAEHTPAEKWTSNGDGTHSKICTVENCGHVCETAKCAGGTPTCTEQAICDTCKTSYGALKAHAYGDWTVTVPAKCEMGGERRNDCINCDAFITQSTQPLGHTRVTIPAIPMTCTTDGWKAGLKCGNEGCDLYYVVPTLIPAAHTLTDVAAQAATCTTDGWNAYKQCTKCDYNTKVVILAAHTMSTVEAKEATCKNVGWDAYEQCSKCDYNTKIEVGPLAHTEEVIPGKPATCTATGLTDGKKCSVCGDTLVKQEIIKMAEHTPEVVPGKAATCTSSGLTDGSKCSACGATIKPQEPITALGHPDRETIPGKEATCTEDGLTDGVKCKVCGEMVTAQKVIPSRGGHEVVTEKGTAATCTVDGVTDYKYCSVCGEVLAKKEVITAPGHTVVIDQAKDATCTVDGLTEGKHCSVCGEVLVKQEKVTAPGHTEVIDKKVDATCTVNGVTEGKHCSVCEEILVKQEVITAPGHKPVVDAAKAPTCEETGLTEGSHCSACDEVLTAQKDIPALQHKYVGTETKAPTCTEDGVMTYVCENDKTHTYDETIDALGHDAVQHEAQKVTCTEIGWEAYETCNRCDYTTYVEITALGHKMDEGTVTKQFTCEAAGEVVYACLNEGCEYTETEVVEAHHVIVEIPAVAPTCTETGLTAGEKCDVCGTITKEQTVVVASHKWETVTVITEATCTTAGKEDVRCTVEGCGMTDTIATPPKGHTEVIDAAVAKTCEKDGLTEGKHCSVCNTTLVKQEVIPASHEWSAAPCTDITAKCQDCGKTNKTLLEHAWSEATCTEKSTCQYCKETKGNTLPHTEVIDEEIPAMCDENGLTAGKHCSVCGYVISAQEEIPALGHKMVKYEAKNPTFTTDGWYEYEACSRCPYTEPDKEEYLRPALGEQSIDNYQEMLIYLPYLEQWAVDYARKTPGTDPVSLVIKYIRTGVERYNSGSWGIMAGYEDPGFAKYVAEQEDAYNSAFGEEQFDQMIQVTGLKNLKEFTLPNDPNFEVDFGHMFGTMDITYTNKGSVNHADVGGWSGDLVDLLSTSDHDSHQDLIASAGDDFEALVTIIRTKLLGYDFDHEDTFALNDYYGDLDAFYIMENLNTENYAAGDMTKLFESYFTAALDDVARADFLLVNRFDDVRTRSAIREAVYNAYTTNSVISTLEGTREFVNTDDLITRRKAVCYAFADYLCILAGDWVDDTDNPYLTDYESSYSLLAPGISMEIHKATSADGKNMVYYLGYADVGRADVDIMANYHDRYVDEGWKMSRVLDQANKAAEKYYANPENEHYIENFAPVVAVNGAGFDMGTGEPSGLLVMHGQEYHGPNSNGFFGITKSGKAVIGTTAEYNSTYKGQLAEGIAGFGTMLVVDGELYSGIPTTNYYSDRASRTAVGITATGRVVFMVLDGRQEPWSCGGSMIEIAQIMKLAGCVTAVNLDGGGSTTFVARQAGDEELSLVNRPSDGVQRSVSTSLMMISTAPSSKTFDRALVEANYNFMTVGAEVNVSATGLSATNNIVALPEGAYWSVSDPEMAEIVDTGDVLIDPEDPDSEKKKTATVIAKKLGEFEVYLMLDDVVIGQKTLGVIVPDQIYFTREKIDGIYGKGVEMPLKARYEGKEAAFVPADVTFTVSNPAVGTMDGMIFNVVEESEVKTVTVTAALVLDEKVTASIAVVLYKDGENNFNFDNATGGNRELAWLREVSNTKQEGTSTYYIVDPNEDMVTTYTVALDMSQIPIPEKLEDLTYMLPGADMEGASAWTFLLQLAERISELTTVTAEFQIDPNFTLVGYDAETGVYDASGLTLINEYFVFNKDNPIAYDPAKNTLTLTLNWDGEHISQAIDPAIANPMCIVSGLKLVPKDDAAWDDKDRLTAVNSAEVGYKVYMRANALHTFASKPENQAVFGLYPYGPYTNSRGVLENGGWFQSIYATFKDTYTLIKSLKNGWVVEEGGFRYYVDGQYLTGIHLIKDDGLYYEFDAKGINIGQTPYTGKHVIDGKTYYMQNGVPFKGWITLDDGNWYLFNWSTGAGINGSYTEAFRHELNDGTTVTNNVVYEFENGRLLDGVWYQDNIGWRYYYGPFYYKQGWRELTTQDGQKNGTGEKAMFFFEEFYAQDCISPVQEAHAIVEYWYEFNDKGELLGHAPTGLHWWDDDWHQGEGYGKNAELYYVVEKLEGNEYSLNVKDGLYYIDGYYYFFDLWTGQAHRNRAYYIHDENTNGLPLAENWYRFDNEGRIMIFTGVFEEEDGTLCYYYNGGRRYNAGLIEFEGHIYGVDKDAVCYVNQAVQITKTNGLVSKAGVYRFDENGHLIQGARIANEDGTLYYYNEEGMRVENAGLVEYGGDIYYIGEYTINGTKYNESSAIAAVDVEINIAKDKTNGLLPAGTYRFDEDGKAILTTELVEGNDGKLYYYMNGALQKGAGMIKYADAYYYIDANGAAVTNTEMLIEKPIAPFPADTYEFGADGKMIIREGIYEGYYYVGGIKTAAGLVEEDGKYYFAAEGGKLVTNAKYDVQKTNDLLPAGIYRVGEDGALNLKTELADENGTLVYYKNGKLAVNEGLLRIDGDYYYIGENGIAVVNAKQKVANTNGLPLTAGTYRFGADGKAILTTDLVKEADGKLYYYENGRMADHAKLIEFKGDYYWVEVNGFVLTNQKISLSAGEKLPAGIYRIGADGKVILTTELVTENGNLTYYKNGILTRDAGLINLNDAYYYINDSGYAVVSVKCDVIKHNNLKPAGIYRFDENGKMIQTTEVVLEGDGKYYYYENGKLGKDAGLVAYNNAYYYIAADGTAVTDTEMYVEKTNSLLPAGTYRFDEEGKADLATELVEGEDGKLYYYVNGALAEDAGLIEYEGAYYYITAEGSAVTDTKMLVEKTNNHFPVDTYEFGKDGKMVIREGIYEGYYYVGGVKTEAGLVKVGNDYYYAAEGGKLVTGTKYDVVKTNDLKPAGIYRFDENGKAIMTTELVAEDGKLYYYEDGKLAKDAGLIKVGSDYYYINAEGTAVTDTKMLVEKTNDLFPVDTYEFGKDGKMVIREGIYEGYYYVGGVKTEAGLVKVGNDYYYAAEGGKLVTDAKYDVVKTNDLKPAGIYRFDEDGKAIMTTELVAEDGKLYYYEDGKLGKDAGLIKVGSDYYYIGEEGTAVTDTQMLVEKTNDLLPVDTYCFGADGKMFERLAGDADENGIVDLEDAVLVFAYGVDETVKINLINANVNGDAVVDMNDALLLMQYAAGWDVELK